MGFWSISPSLKQMVRDILYGQGDGYTLELLPFNPKALLNGCVDDIQFS